MKEFIQEYYVEPDKISNASSRAAGLEEEDGDGVDMEPFEPEDGGYEEHEETAHCSEEHIILIDD